MIGLEEIEGSFYVIDDREVVEMSTNGLGVSFRDEHAMEWKS